MKTLGRLGPCKTSTRNPFAKIFICFRSVTINAAHTLTIGSSFKGNKQYKNKVNLSMAFLKQSKKWN